MRILQLCPKPPFPSVDGGTKAMHNITMGLLEAGHEVKVLCLSTPKHPFRPEELSAEYRDASGVEAVFVDTSLNPVDAFNDLVTADNYNVSRFFSPDLDILIERVLARRKFDVIHLESLFVTPYIGTIRRFSRAPLVLRSHNLEHKLQQRIAEGERNLLKRPYRKLLARQLRRYEHDTLTRVDGVAAITPEDAAHLAQVAPGTPLTVIPFGLDMPPVAPPWPAGPFTFFHLGSMDWGPNEEGVRWLLREVWPRVIAQRPDALLHLAGNHMPEDIRRNATAGVTVEGFVDDPIRWMADRHAMVVPLLSAGGMRVKMVEGLAIGRPVISTLRGAEGIAREEGSGVFLASAPDTMAERMLTLLADPAKAAQAGTEGRSFAGRSFSNGRVVNDLLTFYASLLQA